MGRRIKQQPTRDEPSQESIDKPFGLIGLNDPLWVEKQRLRRIYQSLITFEHTHSAFLLRWAQDELMHIIRDT
jgi:hypothetical protein